MLGRRRRADVLTLLLYILSLCVALESPGRRPGDGAGGPPVHLLSRVPRYGRSHPSPCRLPRSLPYTRLLCVWPSRPAEISSTPPISFQLNLTCDASVDVNREQRPPCTSLLLCVVCPIRHLLTLTKRHYFGGGGGGHRRRALAGQVSRGLSERGARGGFGERRTG